MIAAEDVSDKSEKTFELFCYSNYFNFNFFCLKYVTLFKVLIVIFVFKYESME